MTTDQKKQTAQTWFRSLRDAICTEFEKIEIDYVNQSIEPSVAEGEPRSGGVSEAKGQKAPSFTRTTWTRAEGGAGEMSVMKGRVFEKVGVNISTVHGEFSEQFRKEIHGAAEDPRFWASGISLVAHMQSPLVPAVHMNTRMIVVGGDETPRVWFGGGADLNPMTENPDDTRDFHAAFQAVCNAADPDYYAKFKQWCDEYFWIKHRNEPRGVGGIFYDYLDTEWDKHFAFTQSVGKAFLDIYPQIVRRHMQESWTQAQREHQLHRRGRYAEFNLLYDRGTRFGLMTGGNPEAILMSLPPEAKWA